MVSRAEVDVDHCWAIVDNGMDMVWCGGAITETRQDHNLIVPVCKKHAIAIAIDEGWKFR